MNLNYKDKLTSLKNQGFSEKAIEDLAKSGLSLEIVERAGILPLTPENFKKYLHRSLIEKATREPIVRDGYVIPYPGEPPFGRVKVLEWNRGTEYYQSRKELPKYLQPSKELVENPLRLYYLLDAESRLSSPKSVFVITEGEKKTAKLQQELEKLENDYRKFAALGLGGVWNWDEKTFAGVSFRDRQVFLCFDADSLGEDGFESGNTNVAKAELTLYSFLLSRGARGVRSLVWNCEKGKGIDDYLVAVEDEGKEPSEELLELFRGAVSPVERFKGVLTLESVVKCLASYLDELPSFVVEELKKAYKVGKRKIDALFKREVEERKRGLEERIKKEEAEKLKGLYERLFGIPFVPEIPDNAEWRGDKLYYRGELISPFFVVSRFYRNADEIDKGFVVVLKFVNGKEVRLSSRALASYKLLAETFNREEIPTSESEARKIADYVAKFIKLNADKIPVLYYSTRIGWGKIGDEEVYVHPETSDVEAVITGDVEEKLRAEGEREKELEAVRRLFELSPHAGFVYAACVAVSVLAPLLKKDYNLVCMVQGESGCGKTTAIKAGVSFFASPTLKRSFSFTEGGFEMFVSRLKDFPIHLEEIRDIDSSPAKRVEKFVKFVYSFTEGEGKTRLFIDLSFRPVAQMQGVIFTSSEVGIHEILAYSGDSYRDGLKRRLLVIPASRETFKGKHLAKVVEPLYANHGNLLKEWMEYFKENRERIEAEYREREQDFSEGYSRLDAKFVRFLAAVSVVIDELERLFGIDTAPVWDILEEVGRFNEEIYAGEENLKERVEEIISEMAPETLIEEEDYKGRPVRTLKEPRGEFLVYRRVLLDDDGETTTVVESKTYLTSAGMKKLAEKLGMGVEILKKKLVEIGILEESPENKRAAKREKKKVKLYSTRIYLYPLNLSTEVEEVPEEEPVEL